MAKIISVSLSEKLLQEIDQLKEETGFSGRSDVIRASTRMLIADTQDKKNLEGDINSILILIHNLYLIYFYSRNIYQHHTPLYSYFLKF